jgi:hypothetical protein
MRLAAIFASAFAIFAFHCGGQTDEQCPSASNQACIQEGKACTFPTTLCGTQTTETCSCHDGAYVCPPQTGNCPIDDCSLDTYPGAACHVQGSRCESMVQSSCTQTPTMCVCDGHQFQCPIPDCPPPPMCPPPDQITPGGACSSPNAQCIGPDASDCMCANGTWECAFAVDGGGPPDAGGSD